MKRGLLSLFVVLLIGWTAAAHALGLGEIELNSHLNQKLSAEIPLTEPGELGPEEILVSLGSPEDFERAGVERFFYLTDLRFEVFTDGRGPRIRLTSRQPVTEPYLNFIVEVLWPKGRMLKEFTLLLDPPTYQAGVSVPAVPDSAPAVAHAPVVDSASDSTFPSSAGESESGAPFSGGVQSTVATPTQARQDTPVDGVSTTGQTLWRIAERYLPAADIQVNQYMVAIAQANPDAFIDNNINLMKAGYRLQMPDADAARQLSPEEASAQVAAQTAQWRGEPAEVSDSAPPAPEAVDGVDGEGVASTNDAPVEPELASQLDATAPVSDAAAPDAGKGVTGHLEIVADSGETGRADSPAANVGDAALQEENDRLEREIQELGYQSDREKELAASQISVKDRQLEMKDQQLAELRAQLEEVQRQLAERAGQPSPDQSQPATEWWESTTMLIGLGLLLVLALSAGMLLVRRRRQAAQDAAFRDAIDDVAADDTRIAPSLTAAVAATTAAAVAAPTVAETRAADVRTDTAAGADDETFDFLDDQNRDGEDLTGGSGDSTSDVLPGGSPARQTGDVIGEADIYAAYGRYPHAIGLLLGALEEDPERHDVRLKLLEVAVSADDGETFDTHMRELVNRCDDQDILLAARELEETFTAGQPQTDDEASDLGQDEPAQAPVLNDDGELEIDDLLADSEEFSLEIDDESLGLDSPGQTGFDARTADRPAADAGSFASPQLPPADDTQTLTDDYATTGALGETLAEPEQAEDDYTSIAVDDKPAGRSDVLGGDLGIDFEADQLPSSAQFADDSRRDKPSAADLEDDLDLDDLLAELDDKPAIQATTAEQSPAVAGPTESPAEDFSFTRVDDDVPLLDTSDALEGDDLLADDAGLEDLDELLASLDEAEQVKPEPRSAEILSFSRPRPEGDFPSLRGLGQETDADDADDDGFDFGDAEDAAETKLDLAQAYIEMGDAEGAQDILTEVLGEGNAKQRELARSLLDSLAS